MSQLRRFNEFVAEVSVAVDRAIPRYALWLALSDAGLEPTRLSRTPLVAFCDAGLPRFLADRNLRLSGPARRRLRIRIDRLNAATPTPYEVMQRMISSA